MSLFALILALVAACLHAGWNLLVKASDDQLVAAWTVVRVSTSGATGTILPG